MRSRGFQLVELVVALSIGLAIAASMTPDALRLTAGARVRLAATEIASVLHTARDVALRSGDNAAVKFFPVNGGKVTFAIYRDGDGDGVLSRDIETGVDPPVGPAHQLRHLGQHVRFGFPQGPPPRDPSDPRRFLDRLEDPIRFNRSDLASFNPLGGSTPGSLYLTDGRHHLIVVRLLGITGRIKVMKYVRPTEEWK